MPCFRGLDVSISVQPGSERLPEYPHPDGSSVCLLLSPSSSSLADTKRSSISTLDSSRLQKTNPRVSVYIPSVPGSQFIIEYTILRVPEPTCQLFFKLSINGRHITSWGVNPVHEPSGIVSRALYEPCERWHYEEDGTMFRTEGIESRSFFFSPCPSGASIADDGGLIEVHAYRARGRRRRAMRLKKFRSQDRYGILSPSSGLLERPEATAYFDWDLIDPQDSPFSSFCFHYRDWDILHQLSLIPSGSQNLAESYPLSPFTQEPIRSSESRKTSAESNCYGKSWAPDSSRTNTPLNVWPRSSASTRETEAERHLYRGKASASGDSEVSTSSRNISGTRSQSVSAAPPSDLSGLSRKSTESLATSTAPSVTPSLLPYVEDGSDESSAEFGTAVGLQLGERRPLPEIPKELPRIEHTSSKPSRYHEAESPEPIAESNMLVHHHYNYDMPTGRRGSEYLASDMSTLHVGGLTPGRSSDKGEGDSDEFF